MTVSNKVEIYEINGEDTTLMRPTIEVASHWNLDWMVNITIEGKTYTIKARELEKAIRNATNWK